MQPTLGKQYSLFLKIRLQTNKTNKVYYICMTTNKYFITGHETTIVTYVSIKNALLIKLKMKKLSQIHCPRCCKQEHKPKQIICHFTKSDRYLIPVCPAPPNWRRCPSQGTDFFVPYSLHPFGALTLEDKPFEGIRAQE